MNLSTPSIPSTALFQVENKEPQKDADENEVASFLRVSHLVAKKFDEVISNPSVFFDLSQIDIPQFNSVPCAIFTDDHAKENIETRLNLVYTNEKNAGVLHQEKFVLKCRDPQSFGFREFKAELKDRTTVILSFPNNKLFNALLNKLPSVFSFAIQSTYQVVGEEPVATHVAKWIESSSWPYDGEADNLERLKQTFHDAHHIIRSLRSDHLLANILHFLKSRLKEKNMEQVLENGAKQLSNDLEVLHNEASDIRTKHFFIMESKIECHYNIPISNLFNGVMKLSDFPMMLKETEEDFQKRCRLNRKIFYQLSVPQYVVKK